MKKVLFLLVSLFVFCSFAPKARADFNVNVNVNLFPQQQYDGFVSSYYGVPQPTVVYYQNRLHSWEDVATLFFLSRLTGVYPRTILVWRLGGMPWVTIVQRLGVPYNAFYVPFGGGEDYFMYHQGPPYGHAWGYWRRGPGGRYLDLNGDAIRNRVAFLMTSQYYHIPVQEEANWISTHRTSFARLVQEHRGQGNPGWRFNRDNFEHGSRIPFYSGGRVPQGGWNRGPQGRGQQGGWNRGPQGRGQQGRGQQGGWNRGPQGRGQQGRGQQGRGQQGRGGNQNQHGHGDHGHGH